MDKIIIHQELSDGSLEAVNNYMITPGPDNHISKEGAPHFCYHFGIRMKEHHGHPEGEIVQANELTHLTWHTKGQNTAGVGIMLEGNFKGVGHELGHDGPTSAQMDSLAWLTNNLLNSLKLTPQNVYGHYHFGKPACPGFKISDWIEAYRNRQNIDFPDPLKPLTIKELQHKLTKLGYSPGKPDGVIGLKTTFAIRNFQRDFRLAIDGIPGPQTRANLLTKTSS